MQYPKQFLVSALLLAWGLGAPLMAPAAPLEVPPDIAQAMYLGALRQDNAAVGVGFASTTPYLHQLNDHAIWTQFDYLGTQWTTDDEAFQLKGKGMRVLLGSNLLIRPLQDLTVYMGAFANVNKMHNTASAVQGTAESRKNDTQGLGGGLYLSLYTNTTEDTGGAMDFWVQYNQFKHQYRFANQDHDFVNQGISLSMNARHKSLIYVQGLDDGGTLNVGIEPQFQLTTYGTHLKPFVEPEANTTLTDLNVFNMQWLLGFNITLNSRITEHTVWDSFVGVNYVGTWKTSGLKFTELNSLVQPSYDVNVPPAQGKSTEVTIGSLLTSKAGLNQLIFSTGFRVYAGDHLNANINASYTLGDEGYRAYSVGLGARLSF